MILKPRGTLRAEALRVELECRQEEDEGTVSIDPATASKKSMAKAVNQVREQIAQLCIYPVSCSMAMVRVLR